MGSRRGMMAVRTHEQTDVDNVAPATAVGGFRPDIEGLRALAVILVVLDHLSLWPHGGFVGVDVFFVISGFLITGLLLKQSIQEHKISLLGFYKRRARRILPASLVALASIWVAANLVFRGARVSEARDDVWWALGFSANIHFAHIGTDYFQANRPVSLVQHYWSLAVEEQFYLVWPLVMIAVLGIVARAANAKAARTVLMAAIGVASVASFAWALRETSVAPTAAYFSTFVRAWELGVGAVIAVAASRFPGIPHRLGRSRGPLLAVGVVGIVASAVLIKSSPGFPAPTAAAPVLFTGLVIIAGIGGPTRGKWAWVLTNNVSGYIGRVSYSLYLWHWPSIVIIGALFAHKGTSYYATVICAMAGLSIFSFHFVETPFRTPINIRVPALRRRRQPRPYRDLDQYTRPALAAAGLVVIAAALITLRPPTSAPTFVDTSAAVALPPADPNIAEPPAALSAAITSALQATSFPALYPPLGMLGLTSAQASWTGCRHVNVDQSTCIFPSAATRATSGKVAVVLGDSISLAWLPAIKAALVPQGWVVYGLAHELCPASDVSADTSSGAPATAADCDHQHIYAFAEINKIKPNLVIMSTASNTLDRLKSAATGSAADAEYEAGMVRTEQIVSAPERRVITLSPPPGGDSLQDCDTTVAAPRDCVAGIPDRWERQRADDAAAAKQTGTTYVDTDLWFCSSNGFCPAFVGTTPVYWDGEHVTDAYAASLAPELATALTAS